MPRDSDGHTYVITNAETSYGYPHANYYHHSKCYYHADFNAYPYTDGNASATFAADGNLWDGIGEGRS